MSKVKLEEIIKITNGLNIITNAGVGIKDVKLAFDLALFKGEAEKLVKAFQEAMTAFKGTEEEKTKEGDTLLKREHEINLPEIKLSTFEGSSVEVPLIAFDYLRDYIKK